MKAKDIHANVARGVALLDEKDPQWWENGETPNGIKIDELNMFNPACCVLGQRTGSYSAAVRGLGLLTLQQQEDHGFDIIYPASERPALWSALTEAWIKVILYRRGDGPAPTWLEATS